MPAAEMAVYPIFLTQLDKHIAVVIGGGAVGERKVSGLLAAGARVRLISPVASEQLTRWAESGRIVWEQRAYRTGDLAGALLAFAATDRREVNAAIAAEAAESGVLCNVADAPDEGDFHVPALLRRPEFVVAVGSGGASPRQAKALRDRIARLLDSDVWR